MSWETVLKIVILALVITVCVNWIILTAKSKKPAACPLCLTRSNI